MRHKPSTAMRRLVVVLVLVAAACSGSVTATTATTAVASANSSTMAPGSAAPQILFGSGEMPPTFPDDFPIPDSAKIGSTMVDDTNGRSEMILRVAAAQDALVVFYNQNLEQLGYAFSNELRTDGQAVVTFSRDNVSGTILVREAATDLSEAIVRIGF